MNWITRCPACATVYNVVPDQLKVASGWLRCGHCQQAFDSTGLVLLWPCLSVSGQAVADTDMFVDRRVVIDELLRHEDRTTASVVEQGISAHTEAMSALAEFSDALSSFKPLDMSTSGPVESKALPENADASDSRSPNAGDPDAIVGAGSRGLTFVACVLVLFLALQCLWWGRHALATFFPETVPGMQKTCQILGCQIHPWLQPDGIVIDSSEFSSHPGGVALQWTVRNTTSLTLGMTALELKLQDAQDKVLVQRVFSAKELGAPDVLMSGQSWSGQLHVTVAGDLPVTGYRLLSFYP